MSEVNCKDFNEYQQLALRTLNRRGHVENMLHAVMGMVGEAGEFAEVPYEQRDRRIGELGDCLWYAAVMAEELGKSFKDVVVDASAMREYARKAAEQRALLVACQMTDAIKKVFFYGKQPDYRELYSLLVAYVSALLDLATKTGVLLLDAGTINIRKLAARYPALSFDANHAINRDYTVESSAAGVEIS